MPVGIRRSLSVGLVSLCALMGGLVFGDAPALAAGGHVFGSSFGGPCTGAGGSCEPGQLEKPLSEPSGVAVNSVTGNVYVVDKGDSRVVELNSEGGFIAEFNGGGTAGELSEPEAIAIDNSGDSPSQDPSVGDVYVTDHNVLDKFSSTGKYEGQITGKCGKEGEVPPSCSNSTFTAFETLDGVAVDPKGRVWVYQKNAYIDAFSDAASNAFLSSRKSPFGSAKPGIAVDSEDSLYVDHFLFTAKLSSTGTLLKSGEQEGTTGVAVDPSSNDVYIDTGNPEEGSPEIQVYTPERFTAGDAPAETFGEAQLGDHGGTALAVSDAPISGGDVYVVDSTAGTVDIFTPQTVGVHAFSSSFTGEGEHALSEPSGVAVNDETGDVYVIDAGSKRVEEFTKAGVFIASFAPPGGFGAPEAIAVDNTEDMLDPSNGDVYVADDGTRVIDKFSSTGIDEGQLTGVCPSAGETQLGGRCEPSGTEVTPFPEPITGLMVDAEGNLWVGTTDPRYAVNEFTDAGGYLKSVRLNPAPTEGLVIASPTVGYYTSSIQPRPGKLFTFNPSAGEQEPYVVKEEPPSGQLALVPSTGDLLDDTTTTIEELTPSDETEVFPENGLADSHGVAVNDEDTVYATDGAAGSVEVFDEHLFLQVAVGAVAGLKPTSVTLQGSVNPAGAKVSSCEFEYGTTTSYGQSAECEPAVGSLGEGTKPVLVGAKLAGIVSGTTYHYRLVASNALGTNRGSDHVFTTQGPEITEEQVTYVEARGATLQAQINPNGGATSYHFEYDTTPYTSSASHGTSLPVPSASIGSGTSAVPVSVRATGLLPGTTYYYRVVADGEPLGAPETFDGPNQTFVTPPAPGSALPSNCPDEQRRAEQPYGLKLPDCRAYEMVSPLDTVGQDATDSFVRTGIRAAVSGEAITYPTKGNFADPSGNLIENQLLSRRNAERQAWETQAITPPQGPDKTEVGNKPYQATIFTPELTEGVATSNAALSSETPPLEEGEFGLYLSNFAGGSYRYLGYFGGEPVALGASTDLSHVVTSDGMWVNGKLINFNVNNKGDELGGVGTQSGAGFIADHEVWHAVSADGSRVYLTSPKNYDNGKNPGALYVRVNVEQEQSPMKDLGLPGEECLEPAKACTVEVSPAGVTGARYWGASADGTEVFFTREGDLYEYSLPIGATAGVSTALTHGGEVQGVAQISEEGQYVYFVAKGALRGEHGEALRNSVGAEPVAGEDNLYVAHEGGAPGFIATLSPGDQGDWDLGGEQEALGGPAINSAVVSPNGKYLAFLSESSLTGYDNRSAEPADCGSTNTAGEFTPQLKCGEVFVYDADTGRLVCASCDPTGARPVGGASLQKAPQSYDTYRPHELFDDGALFFDSSDALVPHASDGRQNVYEYENGHVYAISNVAGGFEAFFMDASGAGPDGEEPTNVFFGSADQLLPQDRSNNVVVWDARIDGGFPVTVVPPPCDNGDSCKPPPAPQPAAFGAPASATFSGSGNITASPPAVVKPASKTVKCARGRARNKHGQCVKQKSKRDKAKKAKRAGRERRGKS